MLYLYLYYKEHIECQRKYNNTWVGILQIYFKHQRPKFANRFQTPETKISNKTCFPIVYILLQNTLKNTTHHNTLMKLQHGTLMECSTTQTHLSFQWDCLIQLYIRLPKRKRELISYQSQRYPCLTCSIKRKTIFVFQIAPYIPRMNYKKQTN